MGQDVSHLCRLCKRRPDRIPGGKMSALCFLGEHLSSIGSDLMRRFIMPIVCASIFGDAFECAKSTTFDSERKCVLGKENALWENGQSPVERAHSRMRQPFFEAHKKHKGGAPTARARKTSARIMLMHVGCLFVCVC